jgi:hypothetical protein
MINSLLAMRMMRGSFAKDPEVTFNGKSVVDTSVGYYRGDTLIGLGVSPGITKGRARVAFDLSEISELQPGDIIVCSATDPSWVPKEGLPLESPSVRAQQGRAHRGHSRLLSDIDPSTGTYARIELPPIDARSSLSSADQGTSGKWGGLSKGK